MFRVHLRRVQFRRRHCRWLSAAGVLGGAVLALSSCLPPVPGMGQSGTYVLPPAGGFVATTNVVTGPDGALWLGQGGELARMTTAGAAQRYSTGACGMLDQLATGFGSVWATLSGCPGGSVLRTAANGVSQSFRLGLGSAPVAGGPIAAGPDGAMWFTAGERVGRITPAGTLTWMPSDKRLIEITSLGAGPDGAMWFTAGGGPSSRVGRITPQGAIATWNLPAAVTNPTTIVAGQDGALWFGTRGGQHYGRVTTSGTISTYTSPTPPGATGWTPLTGAISTPDGAVWFAALSGVVLRVVPGQGAGTWLSAPGRIGPLRAVDGIAATADGGLWLSDLAHPDTLARLAWNGPLHSTVAVRGADGGLWVQHDADGGWIGLGGLLLGPPSVVSAGGAHYYIVQGIDGRPWVRTDAAGWTRMSATWLCPLPSAVLYDDQLTVSCARGARGVALTTSLPAGGLLPTFTPTGTRVTLLSGPPGAQDAPALYGGLRGGPRAYATGSRLAPGWTYDNHATFVSWARTPLRCAYGPAARTSQATLYLACVNAAHQLQYVTSTSKSPWSAVHTVPGVLGTGTPGLVAAPDGSVLASLVGLTGAVSQSQLTTGGATLQGSLGGRAFPGVGADGP